MDTPFEDPHSSGESLDAEALDSSLTPTEAAKKVARQLRQHMLQKAHFIRQQMAHGAVPINPGAREAFRPMAYISESMHSRFGSKDEAYPGLRQILTEGVLDIDCIEDFVEALADDLTAEVHNLDIVDAACAVQILTIATGMAVLHGHDNPEDKNRLSAIREIFDIEIVHKIDMPYIFAAEALGMDLRKLVGGLFPADSESTVRTEAFCFAIEDRLNLLHFVRECGFWMYGLDAETNTYSEPLSKNEGAALDSATADLIELLGMVKSGRSDIFEVPGKSVGLPQFDIIVTPPLDVSNNKDSTDGLLDFIFVEARSDRKKLGMESQKEGDVSVLAFGADEKHFMRFRLHPDGRVSYGMRYTNTPSNFAERVFTELSIENAFKRFRALFAAIAYDALSPPEIAERAVPTGSVPRHLERQFAEGVASPFVPLVLPRRDSLRRAVYARGPRQPEVVRWDRYSRGVRGFVYRMREGYRARSSAEKEALDYFTSIGEKFDGLNDGESFTPPYTRNVGSEPDVRPRRARFRSGSQTSALMRDFEASHLSVPKR